MATKYFFTELSPIFKAFWDGLVLSFSPYVVNDIYKGKVVLGMCSAEEGTKEYEVLTKYAGKYDIIVTDFLPIDNPFDSRTLSIENVRQKKEAIVQEDNNEVAEIITDTKTEKTKENPKKKKELSDFEIRDLLRDE